ncbi:DEAD/DEAH box helicase [Clostridium botulinum]|uniref:type I restriction endonuclease subunit R n=1 Tax=Clostridium botulinum TaxID=1491 RepID=UPI0013FB0F6C|nr:type I restriction endonuclease [Clostridium botulinum]MBN3409346.1 DEAD/DEAH box helicase [Clostridium botulinum]MBY6795629.1 type I restriction endonuclease subunit R [Clostridium botulinum]MBY6865440.1 type I restriction endonuclease subunit R [Clostridium botulinum]MBY6871867.1 type I restriction endonuclease subunit R [Clostridium botulinum]MBY6888129.1 type I restriction endonuclease subunit R [Clostridium botulinum]
MIEWTDMSEKGFQRLMAKELVEKQGYVETNSNDFDREFCLNKNQLLEFINKSQPEKYDFIISKGERAFFSRLDSKIKSNGIIQILRKGLKFFDKTIDLFYTEPNSEHNIIDKEKYEANIFSVTQELVYTDNNKNRIDLVIFINGIPVITMELKNAFTHQAVKNAIRQYMDDRDANDKIFNFARCIVHFAVDTDLAYMTTELKGKSTFFMPFNKGLNEGKPYAPFGAGNHLNSKGLKTSYLWEDILSKKSLSNIIEKYVQLVKEKDEKSKKVKSKLIFPRYHQLTVVRELLKDSKENGVGNRYLIQHSAGSGKSNSITWLTHQLVGLYDKKNINPLFDSIVVVTDRTVLDKQIRDNIKAFAQVKHLVEAITGKASDVKKLDPTEKSFSKTTHMRLALENNKRVIICTVQTFPFVIKAIQDMQSKNIAFIIDEAHSSQSGQAAASMNALFSSEDIKELEKDEDGNINTEDLVNYLMKSRKMLSNASYYAFTATPKNKTLETFGIKQSDGTFVPFHTYSMKQAIEEEFILDVLQNYTTYKSYYKIRTDKNSSEEKEYELKQANKKLKSFVEGHELAITEKAHIMIEHFNKNVRRLINNKAKAMVVAKSIEAAIKYKDAFDQYLKETNLPYKAIVAFSGKKAHYKTGEDMSEADMNGFIDGDNDIPEQFKKDEYRFLIVANKYQTGFDQPLLHTMYVDKELSDVQAVQTLSRLNRACKPYKKDTLVLDFYNDTTEIQKAFEPYYTTIILSKETDVNKLNDLQEDLDNMQVYSEDEVKDFFEIYYSKGDREILEPIINGAVDIFNKELEKEQQIKFKSSAKTFVRTYSYLSKILDFNHSYWEMLWLYLKHLIPKIKIDDDEFDENILNDIDMESYKIDRLGTTKIKLSDEEGNIEPIPVSTAGGISEKNYDTLGHIVSEFNKRFGNIDWGTDVNAEEAEKIIFEQIPEKMKANSEMLKSIINSDKDNAKLTSDESVQDIMQSLMFTHTEVYKKFTKDPDFKRRYLDFIFDIMWDETKVAEAGTKYNV